MATAVVDSPENEQAQAWSLVDTLVVEHRGAAEMDTAGLERTVPVGSAHARREDVRPQSRPGRLEARWVPDPRRQQSLICVWVPLTEAEASASSLHLYSGTDI